MRAFLLVFSICLATGCDMYMRGGDPPSPGTPVDVMNVDVDEVSDFDRPDAGSDAGVLGIPCKPAVDQCAAGLTCRHSGNGQGTCQPMGQAHVGEACTNDASCGANMTCLLDGGAHRCFALCDRLDPQGQRCTAPQVCDAYWGAELTLGICI